MAKTMSVKTHDGKMNKQLIRKNLVCSICKKPLMDPGKSKHELGKPTLCCQCIKERQYDLSCSLPSHHREPDNEGLTTLGKFHSEVALPLDENDGNGKIESLKR